MWTPDGSKDCDAGKHDDCTGLVTFVGEGTFLCGCRCHKVQVPESCPRCRGKGSVFVERHAHTKADKERLAGVLSNVDGGGS